MPSSQKYPAVHAASQGPSRPELGLYVPALQLKRTPPKQYFPGSHFSTPVRVVGLPASGVEYHPTGTGEGAPDFFLQYTPAPPQTTAVSLADPAGQ